MEPTTDTASVEPLPYLHQAPDNAPAAMTASDAARMLRSLRNKPREESDQNQVSALERAETAAPEQTQSPAQAEDAAPPGEDPGATGATEGTPDPAPVEPPIEPPRSWSREARERWSKLDPDTQKYLLDRDSTDSQAVRKAQNEAAEARKAIDAERSKVEQARQQYETALPQLMQILQAQAQGEFADIKTIADVEKLAREDWPRYLQWDLAQKKVAAVNQQMAEATQRQAQERQQKFSEFASAEDKLFAERVPDMADPDKAAKLQTAALAVLKDLGFDDAELGQSWNGAKDFSLRDHRVQLLIRDAVAWRDAQAKAKAAVIKPVPPVQRPGVAQSRQTAGAEAIIAGLQKQLETASGMNATKIAAEIVRTRRAAAR
jgi:hypothetical protein